MISDETIKTIEGYETMGVVLQAKAEVQIGGRKDYYASKQQEAQNDLARRLAKLQKAMKSVLSSPGYYLLEVEEMDFIKATGLKITDLSNKYKE